MAVLKVETDIIASNTASP